MLEHAFALRYQVYCLERGFLPSAHYPNCRETDEHDEESAHFGAYGPGDDLVGYVRLVQPQAGKFPFEKYCTTLLNDVALPDPSRAAEVSRLMVRQDYRNGGRRQSLRRVDANDLEAVSNEKQPSEAGNILIELYRQIYIYSLQNDIRYLYAAMERSLARSLRRMNFGFTQISAETEYFGPVAIYMADLRELEERSAAANPGLMNWLKAPQSGADGHYGKDCSSDLRVRHLRSPAIPRQTGARARQASPIPGKTIIS